MRREVEVYAEWPGHPPDRPPWLCGSGYIIGDRLILTAAHVVCVQDRGLQTVQVRVESGDLLTTRVAWHREDELLDVALLVVTDPRWSSPEWRQRVRWGRFVTRRSGQGCEVTGFPAVVATPQRRDTHHASGVINPGSLVKAGLVAIEVANPPSRASQDGSQWEGMSGAAVWCERLLTAVVVVDPA